MRRLEKPESLTMQEPDEKSGLCVFVHTTAQRNRIGNFRTWSTESWSLNQEAGFRFGLRYFQIQKSGFRSRKSDSEIWIQNQKIRFRNPDSDSDSGGRVAQLPRGPAEFRIPIPVYPFVMIFTRARI